MRLKRLELVGFKSFAKKSVLEFTSSISAVVGPNGSGKSNVAEAIRFALGEQSLKSMRGKRGEDLIFNGSKTLPRMHEASVTIVFDNIHREFNLDFDEVRIKREVGRDSSHRYFINDTQMRLRDIFELLASVNIGASGHHIISQGETDRILNASIKDRKAMIEDALGLKVFQWKVAESEKRLQKTQENIKEVELLRKEIAPHLRFLKKQVEKIEEGRKMRDDLRALYLEYLAREERYLAEERERIRAERAAPESELREVEARLGALLARGESGNQAHDEEAKKLSAIERELYSARAEKENYVRKLGRIEGVLEYEEERAKKRSDADNRILIPRADAEEFFDSLERTVVGADMDGGTVHIQTLLDRIRELVKAFRDAVFRRAAGETISVPENAGTEEMKRERDMVAENLRNLEEKERELSRTYAELKQTLERKKDITRSEEKETFELKARKTELLSALNLIGAKEEELARDERDFREELNEAVVLAGEEVGKYREGHIEGVEEREKQEERRKRIERLKIRVEEYGGIAGDEVMKEYEDISARDAFLERELADLAKSAESLSLLIEELLEKIDVQFRDGLAKINAQFQEFFALMFGGGTARIALVKEKKRPRAASELLAEEEGDFSEIEEEEEEGIDVAINLPHKKIRGLQMLSGGERALTSIALLFAISQVNPPPFLVLDETDAALDEANSRKYGDMIKNLSKYSQIIVITHNRETMSRAGVLYGVTMGSDAVSKLLSVKFDEAAAFAK